MEKIDGVAPDKIAYVDETGIDTCLYREYGWSERSQPLIGAISDRKFKRTGIVAAQMSASIIAPLQYGGTMDSALLEIWFETLLLPNLPKDSLIVMDNASFHRKSKLFSLAAHAGMRLVFLPPYSPEYNPIEHFWAWLKRYLRKILPLFPSLDDAIHSAFLVR